MFFGRERVGEIIRQLEQYCYPVTDVIDDWKGKPEHFPVTDRIDLDTSGWEMVNPGILGDRSSVYFGLTTEIVIPESMHGMPVELLVSTGREGEWDATNPQIAAYIDGKLVQGLDVNHRNLRISSCAHSGEKYSVFMSVYTGERGNICSWNSILRAIDEKVYQFYYDLLVPWQCLELMEEDSREYAELLSILNHTVNLLDFREAERFADSVRTAGTYLKEASECLPVSDIVVSCIGHTHIDVAWLWTYAITQEKAARSFSTVLNLMDKYPEYQFMSSQAQLYKYVKQNQPELYSRIKERVKEERWETEGGMFVEADCNLTSGESLVRQFLYGKKFFREEFGQDHKILWLPDVFGYSAALPQIMDKCGIESFMTTKISWNEVNQIPYDSFWWEGIDGTRILTHFITARDYNNHGKVIKTGNEHTTEFTTNYNGVTHPSQVKGAWQRYQQKALNNNVLLSYGYGDGGGGTADWMIETALRLQKGNYGTPKVKLERAGEFFEHLHETAAKTEFPVWSGELYLEYHRGTYTSMAEVKRANRKGEFALQNAETWLVLAKRLAGIIYPIEKFQEAWEILMRNQFHDVLPGSSVEAVYRDVREQYEKLFHITETVQEEALDVLAGEIDAQNGDVIVFNPNGLPLDGIVEIKGIIPGIRCAEAAGISLEKFDTGEICVSEQQNTEKYMPLQRNTDGTVIFRVNGIPAKGWKTYHFSEKSAETSKEETFYCNEMETETPFYHLIWNKKGQIISYYDKKADRELLKKGKCANVLMTYEDKPHIYDNWNVFDYYREKKWEVDELISRKVIEQGPVRIALELKWKYLHSEIKEVFYFYPDSARIDIHAEVDWREDQILLKALFPLDMNAREASYEIQYGNVKRSITRNDSWEQARFEVCFQKWMDLSEYGYGVSFMSDCKYGVSVYDTQVELTLLKCGRYPNPKADRGHHEFTYSIYPHKGDWQHAGTVSEAYAINNPVVVRQKKRNMDQRKKLPMKYNTIRIEAENVIAEVLKCSEDGKAEILRLYECWNQRTNTEITFAEKYRKISLCNMLEEEQKTLLENGNSMKLEIKPYEIVTLKLECDIL